MKILKPSVLIISFMLIFSLMACSPEPARQDAPESPAADVTPTETLASAAPRAKINMTLVKGFLSIAAVNLFEEAENGTALNDYTFNVTTAPDEISAKLISGEIDIAAIPTNMAATVYNRTEGQVQILAVNTLGVVKLLTTDDSIHTLDDLKGKTVYGSGQGAIPEYTFSYILKQKGIIEDITVEYKPGHEEISTLMSSGAIDIATIPEPSATQVMAQNPDVRLVLDLTDEWNALSTDAIISQGCVVIQKSLVEQNPQAVSNFLLDYAKSCEAVGNDLEKTAQLCEKFDILKAAVAMKAIPRSNQVFLTGEEMKSGLKPFFEVLFDANPKSVGGELPGDDFYYIP